jgi:hypothetical protein
MSTKFLIQSSDPILLEKATQIAKEFAQKYVSDDIVGIVFLGAITRGYFDHSADIDIAIFKKRAADIPLKDKFYQKMKSRAPGIWQSAGHILRGISILIRRDRYPGCSKRRFR